jgi:flagellar biosynthesis/type III secretory pathway protein FliH
MNISAVTSLLPSWSQIQSVARSVAGPSTTTTNAASSATQPAATAQISPAGQMLSWLQQLQQQYPAQFQQAMTNLATRLQKAGQSAQANGDTTQANQFAQLAATFQQSAQSGQLPTVQALEQAVSGGNQQQHGLGGLLSSVLGAALG